MVMLGSSRGDAGGGPARLTPVVRAPVQTKTVTPPVRTPVLTATSPARVAPSPAPRPVASPTPVTGAGSIPVRNPVRPAITAETPAAVGASNVMGTATPGGGSSSISPVFNVGGTMSAGPSTGAPSGGGDYTWLLYVVGGLALAYVTYKGMKGRRA